MPGQQAGVAPWLVLLLAVGAARLNVGGGAPVAD